MSLGAVTLGALALAVIVSCVSLLNVGLHAMALAWLIGVYIGGLPLRDVTSGFPIDLFLTLSGVTLLFSQAYVNGTLDFVAHNAMRLCRGRVGIVPIMYFALGAALASAGPGNIATTGLLAPMAMATALKMRISPFLMAIMVGNGCNSGSLSPLAPTGIIVTGLMERIGLPGLELQTWAYNLAAHAIVAFAGYFLFGGLRLLKRADRVEADVGIWRELREPAQPGWQRRRETVDERDREEERPAEASKPAEAVVAEGTRVHERADVGPGGLERVVAHRVAELTAALHEEQPIHRLEDQVRRHLGDCLPQLRAGRRQVRQCGPVAQLADLTLLELGLGDDVAIHLDDHLFDDLRAQRRDRRQGQQNGAGDAQSLQHV
jgi:hypothetical protein